MSDPLAPYGWGGRWPPLFAEVASPGAEPGRVVRHDSVSVLVALRGGLGPVALRRSLPPLAVGDWVAVADGAVEAILERSSLLRRGDPDHGEQLLAANVDLVVVVAGLDRPVRDGRLWRAATLAWDAGAVPIVVLTKADLVDDAAAVVAETAAANPGVDVVAVSAARGEGLEAIESRMRPATSVLVGESGAGKSTLLNALAGAEVASTGAVRTGDHKGRHTTSARHLQLLPGGGAVIDSPGVRAVGLWAEPEAVDAAFADVDELAPGCHFRDCAHDAEPGCAVRAAVEAGHLPAERLAAWAVLRREAEAAMLRADDHARRRYERRFARVVKDAQRRKDRD